MKNILKKISDDYQSRFNRLKKDLDSHKTWNVLVRVINLDDMDCFNLFRMTNNSLEDVGTLYSMLVNCLLDDSSFKIEVTGSGTFTDLYIAWGNDDCPRVEEHNIYKMLDILDHRREFYNLNKKILDDCDISNRSTILKYFQFSKDLDSMMLELASDDVKAQYKTLKEKKN